MRYALLMGLCLLMAFITGEPMPTTDPTLFGSDAVPLGDNYFTSWKEAA